MSYEGPERRRPRNPLLRALSELGHDPPPSARWHHIWRDFVPLAALLIAAFAVVSSEGKADKAQVDAAVARQATAVQRQGRKAAVGITCGALQGVTEAGRLTLTDRLPGTESLQRSSTSAERHVRRVYARAYSRVISERIREQAGTKALGIVRRDGTIDCEALSRAAGTAPPAP